jgi:hypothetical protein
MMFAKKKNTPDAHWINITKIALKKSNQILRLLFLHYNINWNFLTASLVAGTKSISNVVRPETYINQNIDENWRPQLQTPPFRNM